MRWKNDDEEGLSERHQSEAIRGDPGNAGEGKEKDEHETGRSVRDFLRDPVLAARGLPVARVAGRLPAAQHGAVLLRPMERPRGAGRTKPAGAGIKKIG
jgi:hypothetical protein